MKIISKYIFKELIPPFFLGFFVFTFVMLTNAIIRLMDLLITKGVSLSRIGWLFLLTIPHILVLTIPMSVLLAVLVGFGRLSHDSEIIAMKANGVSVLQMLKPVVLFSFFTWLLTSVIFIYALPQTNSQLRELRFDIIRGKSNIAIKPHVFNDDFDDLVIYVDSVDKETDLMRGIFISSHLNKEEPEIISAESGMKIQVPGQERVILRLQNGFIHSIPNNNPNKYSINPFKTYDIALDIGLLKNANTAKGDRELTIKELLEKARQRQQQGRKPGSQWVEIHKKFSIPFACFVFGLIGVPLGTTSRRSGKAVGFAISIGLFIVYYIFLAGGEGLGDEGTIPAWLAMWAPNIVIGAIGLYLLAKLHRETPFKWLGAVFYHLQVVAAACYNSVRWIPMRRRKRPRVATAARSRTTFRLTRILDWYVAGEFLQLMLLILVSLMALSFIVHLFEKIDDLVELKAPLIAGALAILYRIPFFMSLGVHFAVLVATLVTIGKLSRNSEIIAMMACGISYPRITAPIVILSSFISIGSYFFSERVIPVSTRMAEKQWNLIQKRDTIPFMYNRRWFSGENNTIYFFQSYDSKKKIMFGFSYFAFDKTGILRQRVEAKQAEWAEDSWHYNSARILTFNEIGELTEDKTVPYAKSAIREKPSVFAKEYKESQEMNRNELQAYIKQLKKLGFDTTEYLVDMHAKLSLPIISLVMAVIAIPFAYQSNRSGGLMGIGVSIIIGAIYFLVYQIGVGLGHGGKLPPLVSAWAPNVLFFFSGLYFTLVKNR